MLRLSRGFKPRQLLRTGSDDDVPDRSEMQAKEACAEAAGVIFVVVVVGARAKPARMMMT